MFNFGLAEDGSFSYGGWITYGMQTWFGVGAIDFAGGTAVHINAGAAALALALVLGKRVGFQKGITVPHNPPFVLLGAGLLWFGWFGFNAGSELAADNTAARRLRQHDRRSGRRAARLADRREDQGRQADLGRRRLGCRRRSRRHHPRVRRRSTPIWAILLGLIAGAVCALAIELKFKWGFDDSLDVVGIHLVGGLIGTLYLGFFANGTGLFMGGDGTQLMVQAIAAFSVLIYSFVLAYAIGWVIQKTMGFRVKNEDEVAGIDTIVHGEEGYVLADTRS